MNNGKHCTECGEHVKGDTRDELCPICRANVLIKDLDNAICNVWDIKKKLEEQLDDLRI